MIREQCIGVKLSACVEVTNESVYGTVSDIICAERGGERLDAHKVGLKPYEIHLSRRWTLSQ